MILTNQEKKMITECLDKLKSYAFAFTKDYEKAKDLIQDTALKGLINYSKFDTKSNLSSWLNTIMKNIYINNYRRGKVYQDITSGIKKKNKLEISISNFKPMKIENKLNNDFISEKLEALPFILKSCLKLFIDGYSYDEISTILAIPEGTVKSRINKARKLLRVHLKVFKNP